MMTSRADWRGPRDARGLLLIASQDEVRRMDALAIAGGWGVGAGGAPGMPGRLLMELAGAAAAREIRARTGGVPGKAVVLCGPGNNGGDGWVVARHLHEAGWVVRCIALGEPPAGGDAAVNKALWSALAGPAPTPGSDGASAGGEIRVAERGATARMKNWLNHANAIVDGLFGTGLKRPLEGAAAELVGAANEAEHGLKVALDVPSGLDGDAGAALGVAFRADLTVTFGVPKLGLYLGAGPDFAGEVVCADIGWSGRGVQSVVHTIGARARLADAVALASLVPARPPDGHKGTFGHVAIVGGFPGTEGAAVLAARGALRAGAGLVTWSAPEGGAIERPAELMRVVFAGALPERASVLVVGPGLGTGADARAALALACADARPRVVDADALNVAATGDIDLKALARGGVLTPHPLEAARLIARDKADVQADRLGAAEAIASRAGATVVLKGRNPIVASPGEPSVVFDLAEPTLAVGGSGDVLAGIAGAFLAQGLGARDAALLAVHVHGEAGRAAGMGQAQRGALASEIADAVPAVVSHLATA